jgi:hypothetical protein
MEQSNWKGGFIDDIGYMSPEVTVVSYIARPDVGYTLYPYSNGTYQAYSSWTDYVLNYIPDLILGGFEDPNPPVDIRAATLVKMADSVSLANSWKGNCQEASDPEDNPDIIGFFNDHTDTHNPQRGDKAPWYAAWLSNVMEHSGRHSKHSAWVPDWRTWGTYTNEPQPGDIAIRFDDSHMGIVSKVENGMIYIISGNGSNGNVNEYPWYSYDNSWDYFTELP